MAKRAEEQRRAQADADAEEALRRSGSTQANLDSENSLTITHPNIARPPSTSRPFKCHFSGCFRAYTRKGDLTRHLRSHATTFTAVCVIDDCPRSHEGRGFPRQDKLIDHLVQGHKMCRDLAKFAATIRGDWKQAVKNMPDDFPSRSYKEKLAYFDQYCTKYFYHWQYDLGSLQQELTDWEVRQGLID